MWTALVKSEWLILKVLIGMLFLMKIEGYNILTMSIPKFES